MDTFGSKNLQYDNLIKGCQNKLAGWKSNLLSTGSKMVLIKSTHNQVPIHAIAMSISKLQSKTVSKLESLHNGFWWAHKGVNKKIHFNNWSFIKQSKVPGGLGIRDYKP